MISKLTSNERKRMKEFLKSPESTLARADRLISLGDSENKCTLDGLVRASQSYQRAQKYLEILTTGGPRGTRLFDYTGEMYENTIRPKLEIARERVRLSQGAV